MEHFSFICCFLYIRFNIKISTTATWSLGASFDTHISMPMSCVIIVISHLCHIVTYLRWWVTTFGRIIMGVKEASGFYFFNFPLYLLKWLALIHIDSKNSSSWAFWTFIPKHSEPRKLYGYTMWNLTHPNMGSSIEN